AILFGQFAISKRRTLSLGPVLQIPLRSMRPLLAIGQPAGAIRLTNSDGQGTPFPGTGGEPPRFQRRQACRQAASISWNGSASRPGKQSRTEVANRPSRPVLPKPESKHV